MKRMERNHTLRSDPNPLDLIEYGDFTCKRCRDLQRVLSTTLPAFKGMVRHTFRHFPRPFHSQALLMALAAEAARRQQQYPAMHEALFTCTDPFSLDSILENVPGLNRALFTIDIHDESVKRSVLADIEQGRLAGVVTAPTLFLGAHRLHGKLTQARLVPLIRRYVDRSTAPMLSTVDAERGLIRWSGIGYE